MTKGLLRVSRLIMASFALLLLFLGGMNFQRYMTEHKEPKTQVTGQVVQKDKTGKVIHYTYAGQTYENSPVANYLNHYGQVGDTVKVYVNQAHPQKIYMRQGATSLLIFASILTGWAVLIGLFLTFNYWFIYKVNSLND